MIGALVAKAALKKGLADLSNRDLDSFMDAWGEEVVFHYPGKAVVSGTFTGRATVRAWFERMLKQYPEIAFTVTGVSVQNLFDLMGNNVAVAEWDIRLTRNDGKVFENKGISVVRLRRGKAVVVRDFIFDMHKVEEAWSTAPPELKVRG